MFLLSSFTIQVSPDCGKTRVGQGADGAGVPAPPGAVRCCEGSQVPVSSVQLWNLAFFPENDSSPLRFPVMFICIIYNVLS